jgi:hypothetical protein
MAKRVDLKAKQKRQRIIAAVGGVILLGVLVIQGPKTWALLHQKAPAEPPATAAPAPGTSVPLVPPTTAGGAPAGSASGGLVDSDPAPLPTQNQLLSFNRFATKDPFVAQVDTKGGATVTPSPAASGSGGKQSSGASPFVAAPNTPSTGGSAKPGSAAPSTPSGSQPAPTTATISINGVAESVAVDKDFPTAEPIFHLVSLTRKTAKISISGGSFASGKPTITLQLGKTITLMNTADGTRYEIRLVSVP